MSSSPPNLKTQIFDVRSDLSAFNASVPNCDRSAADRPLDLNYDGCEQWEDREPCGGYGIPTQIRRLVNVMATERSVLALTKILGWLGLRAGFIVLGLQVAKSG